MRYRWVQRCCQINRNSRVVAIAIAIAIASDIAIAIAMVIIVMIEMHSVIKSIPIVF